MGPCRFGPAESDDVVPLFRAVLCTVRRAIERQTGKTPDRGASLRRHAGARHQRLDATGESAAPGPPRVRARRLALHRPGLSSLQNLHDHHIVLRSAGGDDDLGNRTTLCAWHHLRGVYAGLVRRAGSAPDALRFELRVRGILPPLLTVAPGERRLVRKPHAPFADAATLC